MLHLLHYKVGDNLLLGIRVASDVQKHPGSDVQKHQGSPAWVVR